MAPLDTKKSTVIESHFTHPDHPLYLVDIDKDFECDGCNGQGHGRRYRCFICTFDLHERCATCPSSLSCAFHPDHPLILVGNPHAHRPCSLCGDDVAGLFYTCSRGHSKGCSFNIHPLCTDLPASVHHALHPNHPLTLQPSSSAGRCLACSGPCSDRWRYRCSPCEVDAHRECAFGQSPPPPPQVAIGHPTLGAVSRCPQPPPPQPTVMYNQNGCLYVVPAGVPDPCAANSSNQTFNQQPLNYSNSNYYYCYYLQGQTGNYTYVYNYQPGQQPQPQQQQQPQPQPQQRQQRQRQRQQQRQPQQQQQPQPQPQQQQQQPQPGSTSSAGGSGSTRKRIASLAARIALKVAVGAVTDVIF